MPYDRPGHIYYTVNATGSPLAHNVACLSDNRVGVSIKQQAADPTAGLVNPAMIANGEKFAMKVKGIVQVASTGITTPAVGNVVYITTANALTSTVGSNAKYGRISEIAGTRGVPTGYVRIDLDAKDSF